MSSPETKGVLSSFRSIRKIWEERDIQKSEKKEATAKASTQLPPPSPSSKSHQDPSSDPFHVYGFSLQEETNSSATSVHIKKVTPGGMADLAGVLFPGDKVLEINGIDVSNWPLEKLIELLDQSIDCWGAMRTYCLKVELDARPKGRAVSEQNDANESDLQKNQETLQEEKLSEGNSSEREQPIQDDENNEDRISTIRSYKMR
eukprot:752665-Hanusia_phi.AAC.2